MSELSTEHAIATNETALDKIKLLREAFPHLVSDEEKVQIPLEHASPEEISNALSEIKNFFGEAPSQAGVTKNDLFALINIPLRHLNELTEEKAAELLTIIRPHIEISMRREANINAFQALTGQYTTASWEQIDQPAGYEINYSLKGRTDPIRSLAKTLNDELGQDLFTGYARGSKTYVLFIDEKNMDSFIRLEGQANIQDIFKAPRAESDAHRRSKVGLGLAFSLANHFLKSDFRQEPERYYPETPTQDSGHSFLTFGK